MFSKLLVANRGEIAVRIAHTCHRLGVRVVAVYSDPDRTALHVRVADEAQRLGPGPVAESYLNVDAVLAATQASGAESVHPGYGFLAENAEFAERVLAAGLIWVGPAPAVIRTMGDKAAAKRLAAAAGVPVLPGYDGADQADVVLRAEARRIGTPLLVKALAGGGGRGMRAVTDLAQFDEALNGARREALTAFGDSRVLLERFITGARHIEVQVIGDSHGVVLALGERDCSLQRRRQKVIEEAPAPSLEDELRERLSAAAVRVARAAGYTNAGTVEFLVDHSGAFSFMEMNARLQVEHPVTELVTGLDLVELQLRIAAGESLPPLAAEQRRPRGHAIEARLLAEDPSNGFLPATGVVRWFDLPAGEGVRVDAGVAIGDEVSRFYDSLLAKIAVHGDTRAAALDRLRTVLAQTNVAGVTTNLPLLRALANSAAFARGGTAIEFLEQFWKAGGQDMPPLAALLGAAGFYLTAARVAAGDPWESLGPWRIGPEPRTLRLLVAGTPVTVVAEPPLAGAAWQIDLLAGSAGPTHLPNRGAGETSGGSDQASRQKVAAHFDRLSTSELVVHLDATGDGTSTIPLRFAGDDGARRVVLDGNAYPFALLAPEEPDAAAMRGASELSGALFAPMPGQILQVAVGEGDHVTAGQTLVVLEAMKMEHVLRAPFAGLVLRLLCAVGAKVTGGDLLIELEPSDT